MASPGAPPHRSQSASPPSPSSSPGAGGASSPSLSCPELTQSLSIYTQYQYREVSDIDSGEERTQRSLSTYVGVARGAPRRGGGERTPTPRRGSNRRRRAG
eukprot:6381119-Pyramimonas_sp.AAC.1